MKVENGLKNENSTFYKKSLRKSRRKTLINDQVVESKRARRGKICEDTKTKPIVNNVSERKLRNKCRPGVILDKEPVAKVTGRRKATVFIEHEQEISDQRSRGRAKKTLQVGKLKQKEELPKSDETEIIGKVRDRGTTKIISSKVKVEKEADENKVTKSKRGRRKVVADDLGELAGFCTEGIVAFCWNTKYFTIIF